MIKMNVNKDNITLFNKYFNNVIEKVKMSKNKIINFLKSLLPNNSLYFITSFDYLPEPLTAKEERDAIKRFENEKSDDARNVLVERNLRLVVYIAKKFESSGINLEDLISIGTVGLIKGINTFKSDKNIKLATYAARCIENEILMFIRKHSKIKQEVSFDVPISGDLDGNELLLSDTIWSDDKDIDFNIEKETDKNMLDKLINTLSDREKEIISLRYGLSNKYSKNNITSLINKQNVENKDLKDKDIKDNDKNINERNLNNYDDELTQKEVADLLGISQSYISRIEKKIMRRLKKELIRLS